MKKLLSFTLVITLFTVLIVPMAATAAAAAATTKFPDVAESRWSYPYIALLAEKGIVEGRPDGTFGPSRTVSNAEFITLIVRGTVGELPETPNSRHWAWAERYINYAFSAGIVLAGELPAELYNEPISRQSMARMMMRALNEPNETNTERFTRNIRDWAETCEPCKPYVAQAYAKGIITGDGGNFHGARSMTLEEAVTIVVRMVDKSYRFTFVDGVAFNARLDVTDDGLMKLSAANRFISKTLETLRFYKENGRYYFTVTLPETPDGFEMWFRIQTDPGNGYITNAFLPEQMIASVGTVTKEIPPNSNRFMPQVFQNGTIRIQIGVTATPKQALVTHLDGYANLLAEYNNNRLERFVSVLVVTNGGTVKSSSDMGLRYSDYFNANFVR
jgi:hypothetical protein